MPAATSPAIATWPPRRWRANFKATFALDLAHKDLRLAMELADEVGVPGLIAPQVLNLMRMARGMGLCGMDSTSIMRVYESHARYRVRG